MDPEYFIDQTHITDLQKLKDEELYFIIRLFRDELENFNKSDDFKLKGLIIACNEMKDLIKNFRFILNCYIGAINNHNITDIKQLLTEMDKIENNLDKIKKVRLVKAKVNELADMCLYKMRIFYDSLTILFAGKSTFGKILI